MSTYVEYNNGKRPWSINASKICSNKDLYDENTNDISGLILETTYGNININSNNGITKFNNDVSFNNNVSFDNNVSFIGDICSNNLSVNKIFLPNNDNTCNIDGNINLNGNFTLNGNIELNSLSETSTGNFSNSTMINSKIGIDSSGNYQDILGISYANKSAFTDVSLNNLEVTNNIVTNNLLLKNKENILIKTDSDFYVHFKIFNNNSYKFNNINDATNINTDFNNQSFSLKLNEIYTFKFIHQQNYLIEVSYNPIFNNYILDNVISNSNNTVNITTLYFKVIRNFQNMDLKIILNDTNNTEITLNNFFVFEYNINTIDKFTDIDNSINNLLISNKNAIFNSLNVNNSITINNNDGKMKLIFL